MKGCDGEGIYWEWLPQFQATGGFCALHQQILYSKGISTEEINPIIKEEFDRVMDNLMEVT